MIYIIDGDKRKEVAYMMQDQENETLYSPVFTPVVYHRSDCDL